MTRYLQENIKEAIAHQTGQDYPCSNQVVSNIIMLRNYSRATEFEQAYPHFIATGAKGRSYFDPITDTNWRVVIANERARGLRCYRVIIDSTIDDELVNLILLPSMSGYCCKVDFF